MTDLKGKSMSELIAMYNELATKAGKAQVTEFKSLAAARSAVTELETKMETPETPETVVAATGGAAAPADGTPAKYDSSSKRGPNQGVGEFSKNLIKEGKTNAEVLEAVKAQFPAAKTTTGCIAYYRAAIKNPNLGKRAKVQKTPAELRAAAQALLDAATATEVQIAEKEKAEAEKKAAAEAQAQAATQTAGETQPA